MFSDRFNRCDVPTPPMLGSSKGASIHWSTLGGHITSSSTKTVILVHTSGIARHICRRLFASRILRTRIFLALILLATLVRLSTLASTVTRRSSYGWADRHVFRVSSNSMPPVAMVGRIIVTSWDVYVGFSGIGMGRYVQNDMQLTIKRK